MIDIDKAKKFGADKIALLGLFAISLLIARIIVASKTGIILSKPIELPYSGLAVCMPDKNGWKSQGKWSFEENSFTISSVFLPGISRISANIKCTYVLAAKRESAEIWLNQKALEYAADINDIGNIESGGLNFHWVYLTEHEDLAGMVIATVALSDGRWLDIEIIDTTIESDTAIKVFKKMAEKIKYEPSEMLSEGQKLVRELKQSGFEVIDTSGNSLDFFFVKDSAGREIGFTMEHANPNRADLIEKVGFSYFKTRAAAREDASIFQGDKKLSSFFWNSQSKSGRNIISAVELNLGQNNILNVLSSFANEPLSQYIISDTAIPYNLLDNLFQKLIENRIDKTIADVIYSQGTVKPVLISAEQPKLSDISYIIKLQDLDKNRPSEEFYFDKQLKLIKLLIRKEIIITIESSTIDEIIKKFPERADFILDRKNTLEKTKPSEKSIEDTLNENDGTL